ncbi:MAG: helix-turn-helix transcriptional regulator, partial [Lachnospiraceae bacterium]|nr:helix-turn-helix transcriptional regulator [Lachnospiraceae bacterium]
SPSLMTRLKRNQSISVHTVDTLCKILNCKVEDIMEYIEQP